MEAAVIGAGPAGLMAAEALAQGGAGVTVFDAMPSAGRKLLMAGRGGLNLTHSEQLAQFFARYREAAPALEAAIQAFPPQRLREWSEALGQPTFVGTSGRVFRRPSRPRPCCARGCAGWMRWACGSPSGIAGAAGTIAGALCSRQRTASARWKRARSCSRWAGRAGRG